MIPAPDPIPAQAPDYIRTDDGATMREVAPGEFVNLAVLQANGFRAPELTKGENRKYAAPGLGGL